MTPAAPFAALLSVLAFGFAFAAWWKVGRLWLAVQLHAQSFEEIDAHQEAEKATVTDLTVKVIDHADRLGTAEGRIEVMERGLRADGMVLFNHANALADLRKALAVEAQSPSPVGPPKDYYDPKAAGCCRETLQESHAGAIGSSSTSVGVIQGFVADDEHCKWLRRRAAEESRTYSDRKLAERRAMLAKAAAEDNAKYEGC